MDNEDYYKPFSQEVFEEIKKAAISIWKKYDDTHGYATEKIDSIKDLENVADNGMYMIAMFDSKNKFILMSKLSDKAKEEIEKRLSPIEYISLTRAY